MRAFFEQIKTKIETNLTAYKTVKYWNSQDQAIERLQEEIVTFPAVFVEFQFNEVRQLALGIKDMDMIVRFRFMFENYTYDSRLNDLDMITTFTTEFDLYKGIETDPLQFTQFEEVMRGIDDDHDMVNMPFIDYHTIYRNITNYIRADQVLKIPVSPDVTGERL